MRYVSLYGKTLGECTYQELMAFFKQHIFYQFMDGGVHGMRTGCRNAVENMIGHFEQRKVIKRDAIQQEDYDRYVNDLTQRVVDGFITSGSQCIEGCLINTFTALAQHKMFSESK